MKEAELYFKEAKQSGKGGRKVANTETMYACQVTRDDGKRKHKHHEDDEEKIKMSEMAAPTAQKGEYNENKK
jgi:hypothetical protein